MRDTLKSKKYFDEFIEEDSKRIEKFVLTIRKKAKYDRSVCFL